MAAGMYSGGHLAGARAHTRSKLPLLVLGVLLVAGAGPGQVRAACPGTNPCQNSGTCYDSGDPLPFGTITGSGYCCACAGGFSGLTCGDSDPTATTCVACEEGTTGTSPLGSTPSCFCDGKVVAGATSCSGSSGGGSSPNTKTCFPGCAQVQLIAQGASRPGGNKAMRRINIGDKVLSLDETDMTYKYSPVFMFGHRSPRTRAMYRRLHTRRGVALTASPGHLVWRRKREVPDGEDDNEAMMSLVEMRDISVADLVLVSGRGSDMVAGNSSGGTQWEPVVGTEQMVDTGLYNPHTLTGNMVVDDVLASCYSHIVHAPLGHAMLWTPRQLYNIMPIKWMQYQQRYIVNPIIEVITSF